VLRWANLFGAGCYASLAVATLAHELTLAHLVVIGLASGVADSFVAPASSAAVRTIVPPAQLPLAYSQLQAREHAAELIGPPLGGALYSLARGLPFTVDAISYLAAAGSISLLRTPLPAPPATERTSVVADMLEGLRFVWQQRVIRAIVSWGAMINFAVVFVLVTVTLRLVQAGVHPAAIGLVNTISAAAGLLGAIVAPAILSRTRTGLITIVTGFVLAAIVLPIAWTSSVIVIGGLLAIGFFLLPANNSAIGAYMVTVVPDRLQGRINAAGGFIANGIDPLAPALAGVLVGTFGGRTASLCGALFVAVSLAPLLGSKAIRQLGRPASWVADPVS
jgi:MFS family permease